MDSDADFVAIHERVVDIIKRRHGLREMESKRNNASRSAISTFLFSADQGRKTPQIVAGIRVQNLVAGDDAGDNYIALIFSATPKIEIGPASEEQILAFCNKWNRLPFPVRVVAGSGTLTTLSVSVMRSDDPIDEKRVVREFVHVLQSVPKLVLELRRGGLTAPDVRSEPAASGPH